MSLENLVASMASRMPWDVGQTVLGAAEVTKGHGWDRTVAKFKGVEGTPAQREALTESLRQHLLCGEKNVRMYEVAPDELEKLRQAASALKPAKTPFSTLYPALMMEPELGAAFPQPLAVAAVEATDDGLAVVFASGRAIKLREPVDRSTLPEEAAKALAGYDEVLGVKLQRLEAVDVVWIPSHGSYVDVRVDFPKGMHQDNANAVHERVTEALAALIGFQPLVSPVNLFPVIDRLYRKSKEGSVVELAFGTTTASLKHEKMRRAGTCLREEKYHLGGKDALGTPIEPYRLSVQWSVPVGPEKASRPELSLHGSSKLGLSDAPVLDHAVIRHCVGLADFNFVRDRIEAALAKAEAKAA